MTFFCAVCASDNSAIRKTKDAKTAERLDIAACQTCGHVQLAEMPTDAQLSHFYATVYRSQYKNHTQPRAKDVYRAGKMAAERLIKIKPYVTTGATLLDIGAGGGNLPIWRKNPG